VVLIVSFVIPSADRAREVYKLTQLVLVCTQKQYSIILVEVTKMDQPVRSNGE
jgi:hypothetical protein